MESVTLREFLEQRIDYEAKLVAVQLAALDKALTLQAENKQAAVAMWIGSAGLVVAVIMAVLYAFGKG